MNKNEFRQLISEKKLILDGATGSNLQKAGMSPGVCTEKWVLQNPDVLCNLQKEYIRAGAQVLYAPTFSGNRIKLSEYHLEDDLVKLNRELVLLSKRAVREENADGRVFVAGDITMTGRQVEPVGDLPFEELIDIYKEQMDALLSAGADFLAAETMMSLQECRAALIAAKELAPDVPIIVTLSFESNGRTLFGTDPETAALVLSALGADAVGANCSVGPDKLTDVVKKMRAYTNLPIIAKPNAGLPQIKDGLTVYDMDADTFARHSLNLAESGADILGGCCGTTPLYIKKMTELLDKKNARKKTDAYQRKDVVRRALSSERSTKAIPLDGQFLVIGERINPTGKKKLQEELTRGNLDTVIDMAQEQESAGASVLDVNMGMSGIDEKQMMLSAVKELSLITDLPLSIDSSHPDVVEEALRVYPGRALINSVSLEPERFTRLIPAAKKYGAMFILLPLSDKGLPKDSTEKRQMIHTIIDAAKKEGLCTEDIVADGLVATVGANKDAALETLDTIGYCRKELKIATVCGLSNISFGLPERGFVNSTFLAMAIQKGLTMAIANPMQDLLMHTMFAADLLMNKKNSDIRYIDRVTGRKLSVVAGDVSVIDAKDNKEPEENARGVNVPEKNAVDELFMAVVKGRKEKVTALVKEKIQDNEEGKVILDQSLIPAINHVGKLFEKQIFFLPQLISAAEAMQAGIELLEPFLLQENNTQSKGKVVIATVEHDIHDIGKNLVALMLKNYGYTVFDLGKDVPAKTIVERAKKEDADIIALSALMTTTMVEMKTVIDLAKKEGLRAKIMVGGAVITPGYARQIGADGYSKDAQEAVVLAGQLTKECK